MFVWWDHRGIWFWCSGAWRDSTYLGTSGFCMAPWNALQCITHWPSGHFSSSISPSIPWWICHSCKETLHSTSQPLCKINIQNTSTWWFSLNGVNWTLITELGIPQAVHLAQASTLDYIYYGSLDTQVITSSSKPQEPSTTRKSHIILPSNPYYQLAALFHHSHQHQCRREN